MSTGSHSINPKRWWILIGVSIAGILVAIDFTIVNICLPTIQHYFAISTNTLQWLMLGFGITFASCMTAAGKMADIIGRRKVLYSSVVIFILASLGAGLATHVQFLIAMRFLQGLASAAIFPCGTAIIASSFPEAERSTAIGLYGSTLGIGLAIGPVLGGLIVSYLSWQWIFFINVPISLLALFICYFIGQLKESKHTHTPPIDWLGTLSLVIGIAGFCFTISQGAYFGWHSTVILVSALLALIAFIALAFDIRTHRYPVIPSNLLSNKAFLLGAVIYIVTVSVTWVVAFYTPLYLHLIAGQTIGKAALWFSIITVLTIIVPAIAGYIYGQHSKTWITHISFMTSVIGLLLLSCFTTQTSTWLMLASFVFVGSAWGAGNGISLSIGLLSIKGHNDAGVVSGALLTVLNMVGTVFVAIATKLFTAKEAATLLRHLKAEHISLTPAQVHSVKAWLSDPEQSQRLIAETGQPLANKVIALFHTSFMSGFSLVFMVFAAIVAVLYVCSLKTISTLFKQ